MQIQWPGTARELGIERLADLLDPCTNADAGARYLRKLLDRFDGDLHLALAAYNYGPTRIDRNRRAIPKGARWYSGYIHRHLRYVLGANAGASARPARNYAEEGKQPLLRFRKPHLAAAYVAALERRDSRVRLDWFDRGLGSYQVVMLYADAAELAYGKAALRRLGAW